MNNLFGGSLGKIAMKQILPMALEQLPALENFLHGYIKEKPLQDGESSTIITLHFDCAGKAVLSVAAIDGEDRIVRIIENKTLSEFVEQFLKQPEK